MQLKEDDSHKIQIIIEYITRIILSTRFEFQEQITRLQDLTKLTILKKYTEVFAGPYRAISGILRESKKKKIPSLNKEKEIRISSHISKDYIRNIIVKLEDLRCQPLEGIWTEFR